MNKKRKFRLLLGGILTLALVATCGIVYQSGSKSTPNEKELVMENEEDSVDQAIKTEEREDPEEETADANTSNVEGTRDVEEESTQEETDASGTEADQNAETEEDGAGQEEAVQDTETASAQITEQVETAMAPDLNFTESSLMEWPVNGNILLDYNMEQTTYFPTLDQYKLNPAIAVQAVEGAPVTASVSGTVYSVEEDAQTGTTVTMEIGDGYQAIYGQLKDLAVEEGDRVEQGTTIGYIAAPTKYYSKEGSNLYFAMKKDGEPVDPIAYLP